MSTSEKVNSNSVFWEVTVTVFVRLATTPFYIGKHPVPYSLAQALGRRSKHKNTDEQMGGNTPVSATLAGQTYPGRLT